MRVLVTRRHCCWCPGSRPGCCGTAVRCRSTPGWRARPTVPEGTVELPPGSTVLFFTDGLVERRAQPQHDGLRRVEELAGRLAGEPVPLLIGGLTSGMRDPSDPDDVCVLAARLA